MESVEYRDVPGYPGYRVGSDGTFWSRRKHCSKRMYDDWHQLKTSVSSHGYCIVPMSPYPGAHSSLTKTFRFHRLVLLAFVGPCPEGMEACHNNGIKTDNRIENLRWGTHAENYADRRRHGTMLPGSKNPIAKLTEEDIPKIRARRAEGKYQDDIAREFGVSRRVIHNVLAGKSWTHV